MFETKDIESLLLLFNISKKKDVIKHCKNLTIHQSDFVALILGAQAGALEPYKYANHFSEKVPEHLYPKDDERAAISENGVGPLGIWGRAKLTI